MSWTSERARVAGYARSRPADDPDLIDARRDLRAARLEDYIQRVVDAAPPLTAEQRSRLAALLRPTTTVSANASSSRPIPSADGAA